MSQPVVKLLAGMFPVPGRNPRGAQLIFTVRDTAPFRGGALRADQAYLMEKNQESGASVLCRQDGQRLQGSGSTGK